MWTVDHRLPPIDRGSMEGGHSLRGIRRSPLRTTLSLDRFCLRISLSHCFVGSYHLTRKGRFIQPTSRAFRAVRAGRNLYAKAYGQLGASESSRASVPCRARRLLVAGWARARWPLVETTGVRALSKCNAARFYAPNT